MRLRLPRSPERLHLGAQIAEMRAALRGGVPINITYNPHLFPTPPALAQRMVDLAAIPCGGRLLEPSAGTGALLAGLPGLLPFPAACRQTWCHVDAIDNDPQLVARLRASGLAHSVVLADFLNHPREPICDSILMNPPFQHAVDIHHIRHAAHFLKSGGTLVAICAGGPRQHEKLRPWVEELRGRWEPLPAGTFASSGTAANTVLLCVRSPTQG